MPASMNRRAAVTRPTILCLAASAGLLDMLVALSSVPAATMVQAPQAPQARRAPQAPVRVCRVGFTVSDMARAVAFYTTVLSFTIVSDVEVAGEEYERLHGVFGLRMHVVTLRLGDELIELTDFLAPEGRPIPIDSRSNDRWFQHIAIITPDMDRAYAWLRSHNVQHASTGPQRLPDWNPAAGGIEAFYFKDPDGHVLEVLEFPPGKGPGRWHELAAGTSTGTLFLGIDHTAIVVDDTERCLALYRDRLGMEVAGRSENYGTEQEHLNNVFGARLRITTLRTPGATSPAIELLEYLAPRDGRAYPDDARANDLLHWQTTLETDDAGLAAAGITDAGGRLISPGVVRPRARDLGFSGAILLRDPDGHALRFVEP